MVRAMLSESLQAVISQTLCKTKDGQRPRGGARDHDRHAGHPQPDPRSQGRADVFGDPDRQRPRHADAGPEPDRPGAPQRDLAPPKRAARPRSPRISRAEAQPHTEHRHGTRSGQPNSSTTCCKLMVSRNGSDLFITADFPPAIKIDGKVTKVSPQALDGAAHAGAGALDHERQAGRRVRAHQGMQLRDLAAGIGRFRVNAFVQQGKVGMVLRVIPHDAADHRRPGHAAGAEGRGDDQARPGHHGRRHRLGQVDHAGGDGRLAQRELATATSSPSKTRSNSCTRTRTAWSRSAKWASTPTAGKPR